MHAVDTSPKFKHQIDTDNQWKTSLILPENTQNIDPNGGKDIDKTEGYKRGHYIRYSSTNMNFYFCFDLRFLFLNSFTLFFF